MTYPVEVRQAALAYAKAHGDNHELGSAFIAGWRFSQDDLPPEVEEGLIPNFEEFWTLYDKKVGRKKSKQLWDKLTLGDKQAIMQHVPRYVASKPDKQYRKDPQTYLRNESWHDEIIYTQQADEQQQRLSAYAAAIANVSKK